MQLTEQQQENLANLIDGLVSNKYQQTRFTLRDDNGYCVGGVMCDISERGTWRLKSPMGHRYFEYNMAGSNLPTDADLFISLVPAVVALDFGLTRGAVEILSAANDAGADFLELANALDRYAHDDGQGTKWSQALRMDIGDL